MSEPVSSERSQYPRRNHQRPGKTEVFAGVHPDAMSEIKDPEMDTCISGRKTNMFRIVIKSTP